MSNELAENEKSERPATLDAFSRERVALAMSVGCRLDTAAALVGVDLSVIVEEVARDEEFRRRLEKAEASCELTHLTVLQKAVEDEKQWLASTWLLERRFPHLYRPRPAGAITKRQIHTMLKSFAQTMVEAIPDAETRTAALAKFDDAINASCGEGME